MDSVKVVSGIGVHVDHTDVSLLLFCQAVIGCLIESFSELLIGQLDHARVLLEYILVDYFGHIRQPYTLDIVVGKRPAVHLE